MEFPCSTQASAFLGEGSEPLDIPELSEASISVSATAASDSKWDMTVSTSTEVNKGKGSASSSVSVGYKPQQGTQVNGSIDISNPMRFSLGTTRTLLNRTTITTTARTLPNSKKLALSLVSHRDLWQNQLRGTWALGMGSDLQLHYSLLSLTTLSSDYPRCTAKINLGMSQYPLKFTAKQDFDDDKRTWYASIAWGPNGMEYKGILSRAVTSYAHISMGIQHATRNGLTWLLQAERGNFTFRVPISISSVISPGYTYKLFYLSIITMVFDEAIGEILLDSTKDLLNTNSTNCERADFADSGRQQKTKEQAEQQLRLMKGTAERKLKLEETRKGLVIYEAFYFAEGGPSMNVTTQLQFWVNDGTLRLPAGSKSHLMGFYDIVGQPTIPSRGLHGWFTTKPSETSPILHLRVRYASGDSTYEISFESTSEIVLPNPNASLLGSRDVVR